MDGTSISVFDNDQFGQLRVSMQGGEPCFCAKDVCDALSIDKSAASRLDEDEKGLRLTQTHGGEQRLLFVTEAGFYSLVMKSRKPEANAFRRWVTHEVLPSIRRDGGYMVADPTETPDQLMARALVVAKATMERMTAEIDAMRPKALFADAVSASDGTCLIGELAKMLRQNGVEVGQNRLFEVLRRDGYLGTIGQNRNVPTQRAMEMGLFRIKETAITHSDGHVTINRTPKVTGKGQRYFIDRYSQREAIA